MRVIVAGSREIADLATVARAIEYSGFKVTEVVSGRARGVDRLGEAWADANGVPVKPFPAQWRRADGSVDKGAGHKRNEQMAQYADALVAVWDGKSTGTEDMIRRADKRGLSIYVYRTDRENQAWIPFQF